MRNSNPEEMQESPNLRLKQAIQLLVDYVLANKQRLPPPKRTEGAAQSIKRSAIAEEATNNMPGELVTHLESIEPTECLDPTE